MRDHFSERYQVQLASDLVADGTAEVLTGVEDMTGFDEIVFIVKHGDVDAAAVITYTVKENSASSTSSPTPTAVAVTNVSAGALTSGNLVVTELSANLDDKIIVISVSGAALTKRYVFLSITCTAESHEVDSIIVLKGRPRNRPVTQPTDVYAVARAAS